MKKKQVFYILFLFIFIIVLVRSNAFVASCFKEDMETDLLKTAIDVSEYTTSIGKANAEICNSVSPLREVYEFSGWAFCETQGDNGGRKVDLVFISNKNTYKSMALIKQRKDVIEAYPQLDKLNNKDFGFYSKISTLTMDDGIYNLYIYCQENDDAYDLIYTGKTYIKDDDKLDIVSLNGEQ